MKSVAIIGLGVIGASLGMSFKQARPELKILGMDIDPATVEKALEIGAITQPLINWDLSDCDVVFIATPLNTIPDVLLHIRDMLPPETIVTDVGSVKSWVMEQYKKYLPASVCAIGGHPLAGSDKSGVTGADQYLLQNAAYVLTPLAGTPDNKVEMLSGLLNDAGAQVMITTPAEHDKMVSKVSHLPHITAAALMNNLQQSQEALSLAAGGLRDTTRIAASNPALWEDILLFNQETVVAEISNLIEQLQMYKTAIQNNQGSSLRQYLSEAQQLRKNLPISRHSLKNSSDIVAIIPDKPGIIGVIGTLLGKAEININDIHIMGVRDENEGSIRMAVPQKQADIAIKVLKENGIKAWSRD